MKCLTDQNTDCHVLEKTEIVFRRESGHPNKHGAIFFTPDKHYAQTGNFGYKQYTIITAQLIIKNPIFVNSMHDTAFAVLEKNVKKWKKQGYDGLIGKIGEHIFEYAVFSKEQITLIELPLAED